MGPRRTARIAPVASLLESAVLQLRVAKRLAPRRGATLAERLGRLDDRLVFVVGSPRSGTTFLAGAIGSVPGFVDLGEVAPVKAAVPELAGLEPHEAALRLRRILAISRRVGLVGSVRAVEQTPELAHLVDALPLAYPEARIVHIVRDGRDVVSSLLDKPWLRPAQAEADDAGVPYGAYARFWVEPERRREFEEASDARRAAWAWRRYVSAARSARQTVHELRYEEVSARPCGRCRGARRVPRRRRRAARYRARGCPRLVGRPLPARPGRRAARGRRSRGRRTVARARLPRALAARSARRAPAEPWRDEPGARSSARDQRRRGRA